MYLAIVIVPFLGSLMVALRGRTIGFYGSGLVTTGCITFAGVLAWVGVYEVVLNRSSVTLTLFDWVSLGQFNLMWAFAFDDLSIVMCAVVLTVSSIVHIYSMDYIAGDPHGQRFMALLSLFTASMVALVTGGSLALLFLGWEWIGVSSFLLIGFWTTRVQAVKSAIKAITINRVGDLFLTLGIIMAYLLVGSMDFSVMYASAGYLNEDAIIVATLLMLVGGIAKSAQVPLHTWLAATFP